MSFTESTVFIANAVLLERLEDVLTQKKTHRRNVKLHLTSSDHVANHVLADNCRMNFDNVFCSQWQSEWNGTEYNLLVVYCLPFQVFLFQKIPKRPQIHYL